MEAERQLSRAMALTPDRLAKARAVLAGYLEQPESTGPLTEHYRLELGRLQQADAAMAEWRNLVHVGRPPELTVVLLLLVGLEPPETLVTKKESVPTLRTAF